MPAVLAIAITHPPHTCRVTSPATSPAGPRRAAHTINDTIMKTHSSTRRFLVLFCVVLMALCSQASARRPPARLQIGTIEMIDRDARVLRLRCDDGTVSLTLRWDDRTRFVEGTRFVTAADLTKGTPVTLWDRSPLFGGRYATKILFLRGSARPAQRQQHRSITSGR